MFLLDKNRKGISSIIGYVILISISVGLSVLVFGWLKFYVDVEPSKGCPDGISLIVQDYTCAVGGDSLELTLKNKGRFSVDGFIIRANNRTDAKIGAYTLGENRTKIGPGEKLFINVDISTIEGITFLEVQPFIEEDSEEFVCRTLASQAINCGGSLGTVMGPIPADNNYLVQTPQESGQQGTFNYISWNPSGGYDGNGGYEFDGWDDILALDYGIYGVPVDNFTFSAWVYLNETHEIDGESNTSDLGTSGQNYLFWPDRGGGDCSSGCLTAGAGLSVGTNGISVYEHCACYMPALAVYQPITPITGWQHITVRYTNRRPEIFLNGIKVHTGLISSQPQVTAPTAVGGSPVSLRDDNFEGPVDEILVYNRSLSNSEIGAIYNTDPTDDDFDKDGVKNFEDNCLFVSNPDQRDTNLDGYGNWCDADYDGNGLIHNGTTTVTDYGLFVQALDDSNIPNYLDFDANGDEEVEWLDWDLMNHYLGKPPGPSGLDCAGNIICPLEESLVGYWRFEEDFTHGQANDSSEANDGTLNGDVNFSIVSHPNSYNNGSQNISSFDGVGDYILIPDDDSLDLNSNNGWTISAWVNVDLGHSGWGHIVGKKLPGSTTNYAFRTSDSANPSSPQEWQCYFWREGSFHLAGGGSVNKGEWHYMTCTYDGSGTGTIKIYEDGVEIESLGGMGGPPPADDNQVVIGAGWTGGGEALHGQIDEVMIFDRALNVKEINNLKNFNW